MKIKNKKLANFLLRKNFNLKNRFEKILFGGFLPLRTSAHQQRTSSAPDKRSIEMCVLPMKTLSQVIQRTSAHQHFPLLLS